MINEEWLCSSYKLCDLVTASESVHSDDSIQVVINRNSFPQLAYNPSSIQITLEAYSVLLDATFEQDITFDQKVMEHEYAQIESIYHFAQKTAKNILDSVMTKGETPSTENGVLYNPDNISNLNDQREPVKVSGNGVQMLAEELTVQAFCKALEEMGRHCVLSADDPSVLNVRSKDKEVMEGIYENALVMCSSGYNCDEETSEIEMDTKTDEYDEKSGTSAHATSLKRMVNVGSIEYPDAPPSTPLLPEMLKSRASFSKKLKGGLAKEFLPSPPPPTPKDQMQPLSENQMTDTSCDKSDFMMRLMRSLSLECCRQGGLEEEKAEEVDDGGLKNEIPRLFDYASQLSADILHFITTNHMQGNKRVWTIAEQLANEIVITSLAEVMAREREECRGDQNGQKSIVVDMAPLLDVASTQKPNMACSTAEEIQVLASELIINAVGHAFAKLKQGVFKDGTHPHLLGQATEQQPWEKERYSNTHLCKDSTQTNKAKTVSCCNDKLEVNCITFDAMKMTSSVHTYANNFAEDLLENSVCDASCLLANFRQSQGAHTKIGSQRAITPCVFRMHEESQDVCELQCTLLWAAASQKGVSELHFDLSTTCLKQQLCRLSHSACQNGWTVGALMASLCQFCDMQQEASRGHYKSSDSLLEHLQLLIDNTRVN